MDADVDPLARLLALDPNIEAQGEANLTLVSWVARSGRGEKLRLLLHTGAEFEVRIKTGEKRLSLAGCCGNVS